MIISNSVPGVFVLIALFYIVYGQSHPDVIRERHIIRAPIKFKVIHHHKIQKVPIVIKKHIHYYKSHEDVKPVVEHTDHVPNDFFKNRKPKEHHHDEEHDHDHYHGLWNLYGFAFHDAHEDYEDLHQHQPLQEEYDDYEYE